MRITGGLYRGRTILCPPGVIRPSMDRMRQSLFSILGDLEGVSFLDLFSGTGILGVEAASRGAEPVLLVEKDPKKKSVIQKNISFVETGIELVISPVERFLRVNQRPWDIVFLDPPFAMEGKGAVLDAASAPPTSLPTGLRSFTCTPRRSSPRKGTVWNWRTAACTGNHCCCFSGGKRIWKRDLGRKSRTVGSATLRKTQKVQKGCTFCVFLNARQQPAGRHRDRTFRVLLLRFAYA